MSGKLELLPTKDMKGLKTRAMNSCTYCNMERKGGECCHGGLKQYKFLAHTHHSLDVLATNPCFHDDPNTEKTWVSSTLL